MAKVCPIFLNNEVVTCFKYDDVEVQAPSIHNKDAKTVKAEQKNGTYVIVDDQKKEAVKEAPKAEPKAE